MECPYGVKLSICDYQIECEVLNEEIREIEEYISNLSQENEMLKTKIKELQSKFDAMIETN